MYVLDTSAFIEIMNDTPTGKAITDKIGETPAVITGFTVTELLAGARGLQVKIMEKMLEGIEIISFEKKAAIKSAVISKDLAQKGSKINETDMFIAGTCIANNIPLITLDKHFKKVNELKVMIFEFDKS